MSALPKQVVQQQKEVEELEKQLFNPEAEQTAEPPQNEPEAEPAEVKPTQDQPQPTQAAPQEDSVWEQKYKTLNGMFQAEVPRLQQQNKELLAQLQSMQAQIAELQKPKQPDPVDEPLITDRDREAFGEDMIDLVNRVTKQVLREQVAPLKSDLAQRDEKIARLEQMLQTTSGDVTTMTFEQRLYKAVPDFDAVNVNPKWVAWLDEIDPFTGESRRSYAEYVYTQGDVDKVKRVVDLWRATLQPEPQVSQRQQELERQVQPTRNNPAPVPQGKKLYTESEATALFEKVRKLNVNGKYDEANQLEAELSSAYVEGRVRG